jgi:hypothetical protein
LCRGIKKCRKDQTLYIVGLERSLDLKASSKHLAQATMTIEEKGLDFSEKRSATRIAAMKGAKVEYQNVN